MLKAGRRKLLIKGSPTKKARAKQTRIAPRDQAAIDGTKLALESLDGFLALSVRSLDPEEANRAQVPKWVHVCMRRLENTVFAGPIGVVRDETFSPYRFGYAVGMTRWGANRMTCTTQTLPRAPKPSARANRVIGKMIHVFVLRHGIFPWLGRSESSYLPRSARAVQRRLDLSADEDGAEFHRGLSDGLRGLGEGTPGDRSNLASDIYLVLAIWWRYVETLSSVTALHKWLVRLLGAPRVGDRKRIEKICERIGLTFRARGRPKKNPTPPPPG